MSKDDAAIIKHNWAPDLEILVCTAQRDLMIIINIYVFITMKLVWNKCA